VGVVLAAGRSERLASVTGVAPRRCSGWGGLSLVERAVRSLLAAGLERVLVVVGHDAGPVATVVGRLGRGRVRVVYADRWADGNGASLAAVQVEVEGEALFVLVTADHVFGEGGLDRVGDAAILGRRWALGAERPRPPGGAGVDRGRDRRGAVVDGVQGPAAALGLPPAPERALGWLLGGRDGRLLLVTVGAVLGAPVAALAAVTATSGLSLAFRVAFLRRQPAPDGAS
jgi:hypothetical protein